MPGGPVQEQDVQRCSVHVAEVQGATVDTGKLMRTELQLSMRVGISDVTRCNITFFLTQPRSWNSRRRW